MSGLQFFTISVFKPGRDQLKVLTGIKDCHTEPTGDSNVRGAAMMKVHSR